MDASQPIDLDTLRGWRENRDISLRSEHVLPILAKLVGDEHTPTLALHGPDVLIGRFHTQHGPVDTVPEQLSDAQRYKMGDPHIKFTLVDEQWHYRVVSPNHKVIHNERTVQPLNTINHAIHHHDTLQLGQCRYRFEIAPCPLERWRRLRRDLLTTETQTALFLKRHGSLCGPRFHMEAHRQYILGRSFPARDIPYDRVETPWGEFNSPDWDLSGLYDTERHSVAFRHACLSWNKDRWEITPLSKRQPVYINRQRVDGPQVLDPGDELALGTVLCYFHDPNAAPREPSFQTPDVVDWQSEYTRVTKEPQS